MITSGSGRCHGPGCTQTAVVEFWCSERCQHVWAAQFGDTTDKMRLDAAAAEVFVHDTVTPSQIEASVADQVPSATMADMYRPPVEAVGVFEAFEVTPTFGVLPPAVDGDSTERTCESAGATFPQVASSPDPARGWLPSRVPPPVREDDMTDCTNPSCAPYPAGEGAFVCKNCLHGLRRDLGDIPALIDDLHTTLSRQDVLGASSGRRASESSLPWKETASEALWVLIDTVMAAVRDFHEPGIPFPDAPIVGSRWLLTHTLVIAGSQEGGRVVDEIGAAVARAYEVIDRPPELLLAGQCGNLSEDTVCEEYLYAHPDATRMKCRACGCQHAVEERRAWMVNAAAEMQLPAATCLAWVKLLMGKAIPRGTFDSWVHKHNVLSPTARDHVGNPLYRFGDVRDRAADWVARPRKEKVA